MITTEREGGRGGRGGRKGGGREGGREGEREGGRHVNSDCSCSTVLYVINR